MASIQCRPEVNALTVPQSYKLRYVPRDSMGTDGLAAAMAAENPNYSVEDNLNHHHVSVISSVAGNLTPGDSSRCSE